MIKALIFDCFGVLVRDGWIPFRERHFMDDPEKMNRARELNRMADSNLLTYNEFLGEIAKLAGISADQARKEIEDNPPNEQLFRWIRDELKPQYKIGLLSNAAANWLPDLFGDWQVKLFDDTVLSYQIGTTKPDSRAYEITAERLGVDPSECLFIDDQARYCQAAGAVGMKGIIYSDNPQLKEDLQKYNIILPE